MKQLLALILAVTAGAVSLSAQQQAETPAQGPTFRTGVDVIAVDVAVVDGKGVPVENLLPPDFIVKIDGQPRRVVSAEHVKIDVEAARREAADPFETLYTTNLKPPNGRQIVIAVDQGNIRFGSARPLLATAAKFLDRLSPADRVAFVAFPGARRAGGVHQRLPAHQARHGARRRPADGIRRASSTSGCLKRSRSPRRPTAGYSARSCCANVRA